MLEWTQQSFLWWKPSWPSLEDWFKKRSIISPPQALKVSYADLPVVPYICISKVYQKYRILQGSFIFLPKFWLSKCILCWKKRMIKLFKMHERKKKSCMWYPQFLFFYLVIPALLIPSFQSTLISRPEIAISLCSF